MSNKVCQICGQEKPAEAFSKSYPNRCRECVAEAARNKRQKKADAPLIIDNSHLLPDFLRDDIAPQGDKWEARHYDLALSLFQRYLEDFADPAEAAKFAKNAADKFINIMQDNDQ